jgi:hypothetical protein
MSILNKLTEGIVRRDLSADGAALHTKWEKTGLLEGLDNTAAQGMAVLLENQAKELLREANTMAGGDVEGFAAVAFPIVRRVFGGLLAQKIVSVQPMSLPSGLIFFMDFVKQGLDATVAGSAFTGVAGAVRDGQEVRDANGISNADQEPSLYGGQVVGRQIMTQGTELNVENRNVTGARQQPTPQLYDLIQGFSSARGAACLDAGELTLPMDEITLTGALTDAQMKALNFDPDIVTRTTGFARILRVTTADVAAANTGTHPLNPAGTANYWLRAARPDVRHCTLETAAGLDFNGATDISAGDNNAQLVRRLTRIVVGDGSTTVYASSNVLGTEYLEFVVLSTVTVAAANGSTEAVDGLAVTFAMADNIDESTDAGNADTLGALIGANAWEMEGSVDLPEISIRVDSAAVTAMTRKLKASWTPELAQDLNAYHNLDAEVELTGILSEQIALEIDQEILADLISGATGATLYWSRRPGLFVNRTTGADATTLAAPPDFTGSVSEWYETLVETVNDVSADIHRKTLRGGANFLVCGPEIANILEFTSGFRASVTHDDETGSVGAQQSGSINKKFDLMVDPYFPRNVILVGRKGSSFLESGYVYAPYVPLQVTPTIFHADDFTPRKAVMTRYGKKMVRPDMFGLVIVRDLEG